MVCPPVSLKSFAKYFTFQVIDVHLFSLHLKKLKKEYLITILHSLEKNIHYPLSADPAPSRLNLPTSILPHPPIQPPPLTCLYQWASIRLHQREGSVPACAPGPCADAKHCTALFVIAHAGGICAGPH